MLHDEKCVSFVAEAMHHGNEGADVSGVEPDGRFVENKERVSQGSAKTAGQVDSFNFTSREGSGSPVESEIS